MGNLLLGPLGLDDMLLDHAALPIDGPPAVTADRADQRPERRQPGGGAGRRAGRYGDPGPVATFAQSGDGLTHAVESLDQPGSWQPAIQPLTPPPAPVAFLARDMPVANGTRLAFVRDAAGKPQWISSGLRLGPRADAGT